MFKRILVFAILSVFVLGLAGCADDTPKTEAKKDAAPAPAPKPVEETVPVYEITKDTITNHEGWTSRNISVLGLKIGDKKEIEAIREVFGKDIPAISGTKSLTGHSLGATGVQEAIYCLLMMKNGFICESANIEELDPEFADIPIVRERRDNVEINVAISNSFGFGGTNATLALQRYNG